MTLTKEEKFNQNWLLVASWILVDFALAFLSLRLYVRLTYAPRKLGWDDWILTISWVLLMVQTVAVTANVSYGLGRHYYNVSFDNILIIVQISQAMLVSALLAAVLSKTSFAITLLRIGEKITSFKIAVWFIIISINLFMNMAIVLTYAQCTPVKKVWQPWTSGHCWDRKIVPRYITFAAAYSGAADIALAILPWCILVKLQLRLSEKIGVAIALSCGIFAGITALAKTPYILTLGNLDPIYDSTALTVWTNAEISSSIIAASIPVLRIFLRDILKSISSSSLGRRYKNGVASPSVDAEAVPASEPWRPRSLGAPKTRRADDLALTMDEDNASERGIWPKTPEIVLTHKISVESARYSTSGRPDNRAVIEMHDYV